MTGGPRQGNTCASGPATRAGSRHETRHQGESARVALRHAAVDLGKVDEPLALCNVNSECVEKLALRLTESSEMDRRLIEGLSDQSRRSIGVALATSHFVDVYGVTKPANGLAFGIRLKFAASKWQHNQRQFSKNQ